MLKKNEKKGLIIYLGTVFGITLLMGFLVNISKTLSRRGSSSIL